MKRIVFTLTLLAMSASVSLQAEVNNYQRAIEAFNQENYAQALKLMMEVVEDDPANGYAWAYLAAIKHENKELDEAHEAAELALELLPEDDAAFAAWTRNELSSILAAQADTAGAIGQLSQCIQMMPADLDYRYRRAALEHSANRLDEAERDYRYLAKHDSLNINGWIGLGCVLGAKGRPAEAVDAFNKTIVGEHTDYNSYAYRATEFFNMGLYEDAMDDVIHSLALKPQGNTHAEWVMSHVVNVARETAIQKLSDKRAADPEHRDYWNQLLLGITP